MGPGLGSDAKGHGVHESHTFTGSSGKMAAGVVRKNVATAPRNHIGDQPTLTRSGSDPVPGRRSTNRAGQPSRGKRPAEGPNGEFGNCRIAQYEWRGCNSLSVVAHNYSQRVGRTVSRTFQQ